MRLTATPTKFNQTKQSRYTKKTSSKRRNHLTPSSSKNPWENDSNSFLNIPKERRHIRFGGLKHLMESNGILEENPADEMTNVDKGAEEFIQLMKDISNEKAKHAKLEQEIKEYCMTPEVANELSLNTIENRINIVKSLNQYISDILINKNKIEEILYMKKKQEEELDSNQQTTIVIKNKDYDGFCKYIVQLKQLLKSRASDLENIRWAQNAKLIKENWKKIEFKMTELVKERKKGLTTRDREHD